jgi:TPP-dependent pyruvate/acetoin dehydrogenase alpha subunit
LLIAAARLVADYGVSEDEVARVRQSVEDEIGDIITRGLAAPWPDPERPGSEFKETVHA